jgi:hypothetical protein
MYLFFVYLKTVVFGSGTQLLECLLQIVSVLHFDNHVISIPVKYGRSRSSVVLTMSAVTILNSRGLFIVRIIQNIQMQTF